MCIDLCVCVYGACYLPISSHRNTQIRIRVSFANILPQHTVFLSVMYICASMCVCVCVCVLCFMPELHLNSALHPFSRINKNFNLDSALPSFLGVLVFFCSDKFVYVNMFIHEYTYVYVVHCVGEWVYVCVCACVHIYMYVYAYVYRSVWERESLHFCVCVCTCVFARCNEWLHLTHTHT